MALTEVCAQKLMESFPFCVYHHKKPDGSTFYVGKGLRRRAYDFSPSRRTDWHKNIVSKYGKENILVQVYPCISEYEAFALEVAHIKMLKDSGASLVNLTAGGEGASGHVANEAQREALAKGRMKGKRGVKGPRKEFEAWKLTSAGQEHMRKLGAAGAIRLHQLRTCTCKECGSSFDTKSAKAVCCSRLCEQRYRRAGKNKA